MRGNELNATAARAHASGAGIAAEGSTTAGTSHVDGNAIENVSLTDATIEGNQIDGRRFAAVEGSRASS